MNNSSTLTVTLQPHHQKELQEKRDLPLSWIEVNCTSIDASEASKRLGYKVSSDGIWLQGEGTQGQFKPDKPFTDKNGRLSKYLTPKGKTFDAIKPKLPDGAIWNPIRLGDQRCIIITEGVFKALYASAMGYPTIALMGVEMGLTTSEDDPEGRRYLVPLLKELAQKKYGFIFAFDADIAHKEAVKLAQRKLAMALRAYDCPIYEIPPWNEEKGKGIDDFIQNQGIEAFQKLIQTAKPIDLERPKYKKLSAGKLWDFLCEKFASRVYFDALQQEVYLDNKPVDCSQIWTELLIKHQIEVASLKKCEDLFIKLAKENTVDPVKNYLESAVMCVNPLSSLDNLACRYLGFNEDDPHTEYYNKFLKWMVIGAVARVYDPGCSFHGAVVLQGAKGLGKTSFFKVLGGLWYDASMKETLNKDDLLVLYKCWIQEWDEIDKITGKDAFNRVKSFLTMDKDEFRPPYARKSESHLRRSIIVGSANDFQFLSESDRRFWVIPLKKRVNLALLKQERDNLWAAAVKAYRNGEAFMPTREEELKIMEMSKDFAIQDEWEDICYNYLEDKSQCWIRDIMEKAFGLDTSVRLDKAIQMRIGKILQSLGWKKEGVRKVEHPDASGKIITERVQLWVKDTDTDETWDQEEVVETQAEQINYDIQEISTQPIKVMTEVVRDEPIEKSSLSQPQPRSQPQTEKEKNSSFYETFPHRTSKTLRAKEKQAHRVKDRMLECTTAKGLQKFKESGGFSPNEIKWVWDNLLSASEKARVHEIAKTEQLDLFSSQSISWNDIVAEIDELMDKLGWDTEKGKTYLQENYQKKSRLTLTDDEVIHFVQSLRTIYNEGNEQ